MPTRRARPMRPNRTRQGFTLLEVVIAALLVAVLMGAVYQALFIYRKLFERGETQTEEIQLIRTLSQQFSDDLVDAIQDPVFVDPKSRGPSGARRFGLFGNTTELRIDVLQIPAFQVAPTPTAEEMEDSTQPRKLQAPELRTVYYSYYDSSSLDSTLPDARIGLTRRELDFETPEEGDETDLTGFADVSLTEQAPGEEMPEEMQSVAAESTFDQLLDVGMDNSVMWAPEVVSLRFRYFDGTRWRKSWDSLARKGLPVAVEMRLAVVSLEDADKFRQTTTTTDSGLPTATLVEVSETTEEPADALLTEPEGDLLTEPESELSVETETPVMNQQIEPAAQTKLPTLHMHRVVVFLPNSPLIKERKPVKRQAAPTLETPTLTAPAPLAKVIVQPAVPKQRAKRAADKWIRNE